MQENDLTGIIKGQKLADRGRPPITTGVTMGGVEIWHPLEAWTDDDVFSYLGNDTPESYRRGLKSSLDCMDCTAYSLENVARVQELKTRYPEVHQKVVRVWSEWKKAVTPVMEAIDHAVA
jgi:hypothetical protein